MLSVVLLVYVIVQVVRSTDYTDLGKALIDSYVEETEWLYPKIFITLSISLLQNV
jgi:hypothetical protein